MASLIRVERGYPDHEQARCFVGTGGQYCGPTGMLAQRDAHFHALAVTHGSVLPWDAAQWRSKGLILKVFLVSMQMV